MVKTGIFSSVLAFVFALVQTCWPLHFYFLRQNSYLTPIENEHLIPLFLLSLIFVGYEFLQDFILMQNKNQGVTSISFKCEENLHLLPCPAMSQPTLRYPWQWMPNHRSQTPSAISSNKMLRIYILNIWTLNIFFLSSLKHLWLPRAMKQTQYKQKTSSPSPHVEVWFSLLHQVWRLAFLDFQSKLVHGYKTLGILSQTWTSK